jgi:hypothetical protein
MKIEKISFATDLSAIKDINDANIDVFVETDDGMTYTFIVSTPKNYYWYMNKEGIDYIPASSPDIIVRSLTEENIRKVLETYLEDDGYWLKLYYLSWKRKGAFDINQMNQMIDEIKRNNMEILNDA